MCGSWQKIVVDQRRCRRILKLVKQCVLPIFCLFAPKHDFFDSFNVKMHVDLFIGMLTIQRSGDIVVRMCGSWQKIVVDQRRCRRIFKQVKQCVLPIFAFLRLDTTFSTLLMLKCM